ncbi:MAG: 50S ribosomal protein L10 [Patescibacteria group bacterium]|jgi:ribosomal protein L10
MAITKSKKSEILAALEAEFKSAKSIAFTTYTGITVADIQSLRTKLREGDARMIVAKKTLMRLAAKNAGLKEIPEEVMAGPVAAVFSHADELAGFQILEKSKKDFKQIDILSGIFDGEILDKAKANQLAALPSKDVLLGQLVGLFISPIRGFAVVGNQVISGFVRALDAVREKKATEA